MKRFFLLTTILAFALTLCAPFASAANDLNVIYNLAVDRGVQSPVKPGDIITVTFQMLQGDGKQDGYTISVMQNEIIYDQSFFEYVTGSAKAVKNGANALYQTRTDGTHIIKASYLSPSGGSFAAEEDFCTFQLRVVGTSGSGWISCDWSRAQAYDGKNKACTVSDGNGDPSADLWISASGPCHTFSDVSFADWYHGAVDYVSLRGLMGGVGNNAFSPNTTMTRAMLVTVLYRLSGSPAVTGGNPFRDVQNGQWYTDAVIWANENNVVTGYGNGLFGTNDSVTREQIATIMCRYAKQQGVDVAKTCSLAHFNDAASVSSWSDASVRWANSIGLITGRTTTTLAPQNTATRAEVATILMRLCETVLN